MDYVRAYVLGQGPNQHVETSYSVFDCNRNGIRDAKEGFTCECQDGIDNDGDGLDGRRTGPGLRRSRRRSPRTRPLLVCDNGIDDDGDTLIGLSAEDPGCSDVDTDTDEKSPSLVCDNGIDDDMRHLRGLPLADPGCEDAGTDTATRGPRPSSATTAIDDDDVDTHGGLPRRPPVHLAGQI